MRIEMVDPEGVLLNELTMPGITQANVALTYAFVMRQCGDNANYARLNAAITERWKGKTALERVKKLAWDHLRGATQVERFEAEAILEP